MDCPQCRTDLQMSYRDAVEIDYCPQCRGVWLDRGELDKIVERAMARPSPSVDHDQRPRDRYDERRDSHGDDSDRGTEKKKRGSWLSELFDFGD
jgi:Zn-finger nucleic acid-binding protein